MDAADRPIRQYSMGMTQRCALAAALLGSPHILILDEPSNGLDPAGIRWLRTQIRAWADKGRAVLVSTHQLADLALVVDQFIVLHNGAVAFDGPVDAMLRPGAGSLAFMLIVEPTALLGAPSVAKWLPGASGLALTLAPDPNLLNQVEGGVLLLAWTVLAVAIGNHRLATTDV